jgi:DNA-directed RNA polymerase subunit RPC12/RpoP
MKTTERTDYVCRECGRLRPVENVLTRDNRQPLLRRIRCIGKCGGRRTEHLAVTAPDFSEPARW